MMLIELGGGGMGDAGKWSSGRKKERVVSSGRMIAVYQLRFCGLLLGLMVSTTGFSETHVLRS